MSRAPTDKQVHRGSIGAYGWCVVSGLGVGAFVNEPVIGLIAGAVAGLPVAGWLVPAALREWLP